MNRRSLESSLVAMVLALGIAGCVPAVPREHWTLVAGTLIEARLRDSLASRGKNAAESISASVTADVTNALGQIVIPAGSIVALRIAGYGVAARRSDRRNPLNVTSVSIRGAVYPVSVSVEPVTTARMRNEIYRAPSDVVVMRGTRILFSLPHALTVSSR